MKLIALDTVIMPNVVISLPTITVQQHHLYTQLSHLVALTNQILPSDTEPMAGRELGVPPLMVSR